MSDPEGLHAETPQLTESETIEAHLATHMGLADTHPLCAIFKNPILMKQILMVSRQESPYSVARQNNRTNLIIEKADEIDPDNPGNWLKSVKTGEPVSYAWEMSTHTLTFSRPTKLEHTIDKALQRAPIPITSQLILTFNETHTQITSLRTQTTFENPTNAIHVAKWLMKKRAETGKTLQYTNPTSGPSTQCEQALETAILKQWMQTTPAEEMSDQAKALNFDPDLIQQLVQGDGADRMITQARVGAVNTLSSASRAAPARIAAITASFAERPDYPEQHQQAIASIDSNARFSTEALNPADDSPERKTPPPPKKLIALFAISLISTILAGINWLTTAVALNATASILTILAPAVLLLGTALAVVYAYNKTETPQRHIKIPASPPAISSVFNRSRTARPSKSKSLSKASRRTRRGIITQAAALSFLHREQINTRCKTTTVP